MIIYQFFIFQSFSFVSFQTSLKNLKSKFLFFFFLLRSHFWTLYVIINLITGNCGDWGHFRVVKLLHRWLVQKSLVFVSGFCIVCLFEKLLSIIFTHFTIKVYERVRNLYTRNFCCENLVQDYVMQSMQWCGLPWESLTWGWRK